MSRFFKETTESADKDSKFKHLKRKRATRESTDGIKPKKPNETNGTEKMPAKFLTKTVPIASWRSKKSDVRGIPDITQGTAEWIK